MTAGLRMGLFKNNNDTYLDPDELAAADELAPGGERLGRERSDAMRRRSASIFASLSSFSFCAAFFFWLASVALA